MTHKHEHPWEHYVWNNKIRETYERETEEHPLFYLMIWIGVLVLTVALVAWFIPIF